MSRHAINGRIGALESWARTTDRAARTRPGFRRSPASIEYWLDRVDPEGRMGRENRLKAAEAARRAYMLRLAEASARARAARKRAA